METLTRKVGLRKEHLVATLQQRQYPSDYYWFGRSAYEFPPEGDVRYDATDQPQKELTVLASVFGVVLALVVLFAFGALVYLATTMVSESLQRFVLMP